MDEKQYDKKNLKLVRAVSPIHPEVLKKYINMTSQDQEALKRLKPVLLPHLSTIIDTFYENLLKFPFSHSYFQQPGLIERLKSAQTAYFETLLEGKFDENYITQRKMIGETHQRVGLEPRWYLGGYSLFCQIIFPIIREHYQDDATEIENAQLALLKAFFLDMQIAMETYIENYAGELVDARRALEQKLWMEDRLLSFILTEASDAIIGLDEHGRIATWSQGAQRLFGYKTGEVLETELSDLIKNHEALHYAKMNMMEHGSATLYGSEWCTKEGKTIIADATLTLLSDNEGTDIGSTLIVRDTTEIRRLATKVKNMEQLSAMTKVTAGVAHEIRTPLGVMALTGDMLSDRLTEICEKLPEEEQEAIKEEVIGMVGDIQTEVDRLNEIVDHYLVLSRIKRPKRTPMNLLSFMQNMEEEMKKRFPNCSIQFDLQIEDPESSVNIDPDHFRRVFLNLCENACYAIQEDGTITIRCIQQKGIIRLQFEDNGCGISKEQLDKIFTAFVTNKPSGTGLGLYLVREIVEAHDGSVHIESGEGQGTTVYITMPIHKEEEMMDVHSS